MDHETILLEQRGHIGTITLNRPEKMNTFTTEMARELIQSFLGLDNDQECRVIVVRGAGRAFSTGIDISEFFGKSPREYEEWVGDMEEMILVIARMKKPVIASAHGYVVANGAGLLLACDLAVVAEGTKIGTTAINAGLFCMGPAVPLSRHLGKKRCLEMLLTGDLIDANVAEQWGLVNRVVPLDQLEEATMDLAQKLAGKSPIALQMGKQAYYGMLDMELGKAMEYSNQMFTTLCMTDDAGEGVRAFLEKRKPRWKGR
ncbi:MAG: enoyl-CoA hydratase/isomerase family protein [Deltaproteobacteria bacterium]|nr:enoyl-CoA hydratase/isomerase family protein [Deltaproteobacteria bacterium]